MVSRLGCVALGLVLGAVLCMGFRHLETTAWRASLAELEARTALHDSLGQVKDDSVEALQKVLAAARTDDSVASAQLVSVDTLAARRDSAVAADTACAPAIEAATNPLLAQIDARDVVIEAKQRAIVSYDHMNALLTGQLVTERTLRYDWQHRAQTAPVRGERGLFATARGFVELARGDGAEVGAGGTLTWRTGGPVDPYVDVAWRPGEAQRVQVGGSLSVKLF